MTPDISTPADSNVQSAITAALKGLQRAVMNRGALMVSEILGGPRSKPATNIFEELGTPEEAEIARAHAAAAKAFNEMTAGLRARLRLQETEALQKVLALCGGGEVLGEGCIQAVLHTMGGEPMKVCVVGIDSIRATGRGFTMRLTTKRSPELNQREQVELYQERDDLRLVLAPVDRFF